jgi:hypothetical protein
LWVPVASGPLAPYAGGYGSWLAARGYSRWAIAHRLWQLDLLSRWLDREGLSPGELTPERVQEFLLHSYPNREPAPVEEGDRPDLLGVDQRPPVGRARERVTREVVDYLRQLTAARGAAARCGRPDVRDRAGAGRQDSRAERPAAIPTAGRAT